MKSIKSLAEKIAVMQHFANGGEVEMQHADGSWRLNRLPVWDWPSCDYRIKQPVDPYAELKAANTPGSGQAGSRAAHP